MQAITEKKKKNTMHLLFISVYGRKFLTTSNPETGRDVWDCRVHHSEACPEFLKEESIALEVTTSAVRRRFLS